MINFNRLSVNDYVKVQLTDGNSSNGYIIEGTITKLWNDKEYIQAQINYGWCFHQEDNLIEHKIAKV